MSIELTISPRPKDLGGFSVRRVLPYAQKRMVGPWIFFDHLGPVTFGEGKGIDVRPHPHINLATVTYLFDGEILHRDCLGSVQTITPGDINLMVAGKGITHSERERPEIRSTTHSVHALQLWLALPEEDEETDPSFTHYPAADLPKTEQPGVSIRVMMGEAFGLRSPVKTFARTLYVEAAMQPRSTLTLPEEEERALYLVSGAISIDERKIDPHTMVTFKKSESVTIQAQEASQVVLIGGDPLGERHIEWNFVSSRPERIEQAKQQWRDEGFDKIPGDDKDFIPLPE